MTKQKEDPKVVSIITKPKVVVLEDVKENNVSLKRNIVQMPAEALQSNVMSAAFDGTNWKITIDEK